MARDYQSTLRVIIQRLSVYVARWQLGLRAGMTPEQIVAFVAFMDALDNFKIALGQEEIDP